MHPNIRFSLSSVIKVYLVKNGELSLQVEEPGDQKRPAAKKGGNQWVFFFGSNNL
jgi:hypothetical protein